MQLSQHHIPLRQVVQRAGGALDQFLGGLEYAFITDQLDEERGCEDPRPE